MSLVADYSGSSSDEEEPANNVAEAEGSEEPKKKKMKLPAAEFDEPADVTIFRPAEEEVVREVPKNFSYRSLAPGRKGQKGDGKGGKGGKGKGAKKTGSRPEDGAGPSGQGSKTSSGALTFDEDVTTKQRMAKKLTKTNLADYDVDQTMVTEEVKRNAAGAIKQRITITRRHDAAPINHKNITMREIWPKEMKRC